jgi:hypothetical protein
MRILIACEKSGVIRRAFRNAGHDAWSCDIESSEDNSEYHLQCDVRKVLGNHRIKWDMLIAHPECTYLCSSGLHWNKRVTGRQQKTEEALEFVQYLMDSRIKKKCIENPQGRIGTAIRKADQYIQPYQFGHDASKKTGLWLENLPALIHTQKIAGRLVEWPSGSGKIVERWANQTDSGQNRLAPSKDRSALRARTYEGWADAMADQWGNL